MAKQLRDITESKHIHVHPIGKGQYEVHSVGSSVNPTHAKVGDKFNSTELDDLSEGGYKVAEKKAPVVKKKGGPVIVDTYVKRPRKERGH